MSEKKRKVKPTVKNTSRKRVAFEGEDGPVKVNVVPSNGFSKPVIASSPGVSLPSNASFDGYTNGVELLLQSSSHPTIDFTGTEDSKADQTHLKHYVGIFDPATKKLSLVEARRITVRGQLRSRLGDDEERSAADAAAAAAAISNYTSRAALTETFGTKKSKKAVQSVAENRLLAQDGDGEAGTTNPLSEAFLATMPTETVLPDGEVDLVQENKPLPKANLAALTSDAAYPLSSLVFPSPSALDKVDVSDWQALAASGQDIQVLSRFVASRVEAYIEASLSESEKSQDNKSPALRRLRLLRYALILIELSRFISVPGRSDRGRSVPPPKKLLQRFSDPKPPLYLLEGIRRHFVPKDDTMRSFETQRLHTTICALALHLPSRRTLDRPNYHFTIEPSDLRDDLSLDDKTIRHYFKELGCRVDSLTETESAVYGVKKSKRSKEAEASGDALKAKTHDVRIAKLRIPLRFPKQSVGRPGR